MTDTASAETSLIPAPAGLTSAPADLVFGPIGWPERPYRGLDFYRETEAALFSGRENDIERCANLLLRFGVKVLLLQGSSGSGKSSFIRAGLLPYIKRTTANNPRQQSFFLSADEGVIRCTVDPLREIARSILAAIDQPDPFTAGFAGETHQVSSATREQIREKVTRATQGSRLAAHEPLVDALALLVADLPGRLVIILDQAEEVLTRSDGTFDSTNDASSGFFRFLEDVYLQNIDVRIIVSLRTEYYGRFRDELAISDNNFSSKTSRGGVEPFLLRPLRDPDALKQIILAPTGPGKPYNFTIEDELAGRIVGDLLKQLPFASVTPALQVVCSSLYLGKGSDKRIVEAVYERLGGLQGIIRKYVQDGIAVAGPASEQETEEWYLLLYSLVSRQGGGTIVSLTESADDLAKRALEKGIPAPIKPRLVALSTGAVPLLRGEPPADPKLFSLKHDVLAIVLARWFDEHDGAIRAREQERAQNERARELERIQYERAREQQRAQYEKARIRERYIRWGIVGVALALIIFAGFVAYDRARASFEARKTTVALRNAYVERAPHGDYRQSLLLTLASLKRLAERRSWYEQIWSSTELADSTTATLRSILPRVPRLAAANIIAVGVDSQAGRIALLRQDGLTGDLIGGLVLRIVNLPRDNNLAPLASQSLMIPADRVAAASRGSLFATTTGFLTGIGPAVYAGGKLFFWDSSGDLEERDILAALPPELKSPPPRAEFVGGNLHIVHMNWVDRDNKMRVMRLDAEILRQQPLAPQRSFKIFDHPTGEPFPVLSIGNGRRTYQASFASEPRPRTVPDGIPFESLDPSDLDKPQYLLSANVAPSEGDVIKVPLAVVTRQPRPVSPLAILERRRVTLAFVENADALVFKSDGPQFHIVDIKDSARENVVRRAFSLPATDEEGWAVYQSNLPFLHPVLAAAKSLDHWLAAWLTEEGVWSVRTEGLDGGKATTFPAQPLMAGEPGGVKLQYLVQGGFLMLLQQKQWGAPTTIRVWDLRPVWQDALDKATLDQLVKFACALITADGSNTVISAADVDQFQITRRYRNPCEQKGGR